MLEKKKNYLKILSLELEDLHEDIELLVRRCEAEKDNEQITKYVFLENLALFKNEMLGVDVFGKLIDSIEPQKFETLDQMIGVLKKSFEEKMIEYGISNAIHLSILRKMDKVKRYVTQ